MKFLLKISIWLKETFKLLEDTHVGWNQGGADGFNHLVIGVGVRLAAVAAFSFILKLASPLIVLVLASIVMFVVFAGGEFLQEKAMVKDGKHPKGNEFKPWTWSPNRYQDVYLDLIAGLVMIAGAFAIF